MSLSLPDDLLGARLAACNGNDEAGDQRVQVESAVEPVGEGSQVVGGVFAVVKGMVGTCERRLEVAQDGVDPGEFGQVAGLAITDDGRHVDATGIYHCREASQAVTGDHRAGRQMHIGPLFDRVTREADHRGELEVNRMAHLIERDRGNERHLVLRASAGRAAAEFATEVGVVHLHDIGELMSVLALGHRAHDLVVYQPGGAVAHAQLTLEGERREASLGLTDQVDGEEPGRQRELGSCEQGARGHRGLPTAPIALEQGTEIDVDHAVRFLAALGTLEAIGPTGGHHGLRASSLRSESAEEFRQ